MGREGGYPSLWSQVLSRGGGYPSLWSHILFQGSLGPFWGRKEGGTPVSGPRSLFQPLVPGHFWGEGVPQPLVLDPPGSFSGVSQSGARTGYPRPAARTRTGGTPQPGPGQRGTPWTEHDTDRICSGQYTSCGHAGGLSCSFLGIQKPVFARYW